MLKRKLELDKKKIQYRLWSLDHLKRKLITSFQKNHYQIPAIRLGFFLYNKTNNKDNKYFFYRSQNKLQCFMSYSHRVPSKHIHMSRFFLSRSLNTLSFYKFQK